MIAKKSLCIHTVYDQYKKISQTENIPLFNTVHHNFPPHNPNPRIKSSHVIYDNVTQAIFLLEIILCLHFSYPVMQNCLRLKTRKKRRNFRFSQNKITLPMAMSPVIIKLDFCFYTILGKIWFLPHSFIFMQQEIELAFSISSLIFVLASLYRISRCSLKYYLLSRKKPFYVKVFRHQ